jgi:DNA-binding IscR family transcriptional regulator
MKLSKASRHSPRALAHLAGRGGGPVEGRLIGKLEKIPALSLRKALASLVAAGLLREGTDRGFRLARPLWQITLVEVVEAVGGPIRGEVPPPFEPSEEEEKLNALVSALCVCLDRDPPVPLHGALEDAPGLAYVDGKLQTCRHDGSPGFSAHLTGRRAPGSRRLPDTGGKNEAPPPVPRDGRRAHAPGGRITRLPSPPGAPWPWWRPSCRKQGRRRSPS